MSYPQLKKLEFQIFLLFLPGKTFGFTQSVILPGKESDAIYGSFQYPVARPRRDGRFDHNVSHLENLFEIKINSNFKEFL